MTTSQLTCTWSGPGALVQTDHTRQGSPSCTTALGQSHLRRCLLWKAWDIGKVEKMEFLIWLTFRLAKGGVGQAHQYSGVFHNSQPLQEEMETADSFYSCPQRFSEVVFLFKTQFLNCCKLLEILWFSQTTPIYSKWKLRWVFMLFTKYKENRDQELAKWQTLKSDNA